MTLNEKNLQIIKVVLEEKIGELEYPCENCLYFDCQKNPLNKQLLKKHRWEPVIDWKECLKQTAKQREQLQKITKKIIEANSMH